MVHRNRRARAPPKKAPGRRPPAVEVFNEGHWPSDAFASPQRMFPTSPSRTSSAVRLWHLRFRVGGRWLRGGAGASGSTRNQRRRARAAVPSRARNARSPAAAWMARARAPTSPSGNSMPSTPSRTSSRAAGISLAMRVRPLAMLSRQLSDKPSEAEACTVMSASA